MSYGQSAALRAPPPVRLSEATSPTPALQARPSAALFGEVFPGVPLTRDIGEFETLLAIDRAREVIGYEPRHSWRDHISES